VKHEDSLSPSKSTDPELNGEFVESGAHSARSASLLRVSKRASSKIERIGKILAEHTERYCL
jgi:hypothetical protein